MKPVDVAGLHFETRAACKDHVRALLACYQVGQTLSETDTAFMLALLEQHPDSASKIGCGVASFRLSTDTHWRKTQYARIVRIDGSEEDFSWQKCIDGESQMKKVLGALRVAVSDQVIAFRDRELVSGAVCPFRGVRLTADTSHVDHVRPLTFQQLAESWLAGRDVQLAKRDFYSEIEDPDALASWRAFHLERARLRLVSKAANLSDAKKN